MIRLEKLVYSGSIAEDELVRVRRDVALIRDRAGDAGLYAKNKSYVDKNYRDALTYHIKYEESPFIYNVINSYILELYCWTKINLAEIPEVQYSRYEVGGRFLWHKDVIASQKLLRGLTFSLNLSDESDYGGGTLQVETSDKKISHLEKKAGSFIVFPAFLKHQANEVTFGTRESLVIWTQVNKYDLQWLRKNEI